MRLAREKAIQDEDTKRREQKTKTLIKIVPIIDSMIVASNRSPLDIRKMPTLSAPVEAFSRRFISWCAIIGGFNLISNCVDKMTQKSPKLKEIKHEHPIQKTIGDVAVIFGLYEAGKYSLPKIYKNISASNKQKAVKTFQRIKKSLDSSFISKKIYEPLAKKLAKSSMNHSAISRLIKRIKPAVVPTMIATSIVKASIIDPIDLRNKTKSNYLEIIKNTQNNLSKSKKV